MTVGELAKKLNMSVLTGEKGQGNEVTGAYACDLLSWVMSHAQKGQVWVTVHTHLNVVAVALLTEVACVIIPEDISVDEATVRKACEEGIALLSTQMTAYEICWKVHSLLAD